MKTTWGIKIDGDDILIENVKATCFGGPYDAGDDGQTESGIMNDGSNSIKQIALPIRSTEHATACSPLANPRKPHIPWETICSVWRASEGEGSARRAMLTDNGPDVALYPDHAMDFNPELVLDFEPDADPKKVANNWMGVGFCCRIPGGAKYVVDRITT